MRWAAIFVACGCNQVLGIDRTTLIDAPPAVDAPPPPTCPPIGQTPTFTGELRQLPAKFCIAYTPSVETNTALASCNFVVSGGVVDGELAPITITNDPGHVFPRLAPEGDRFVFAKRDPDTASSTFAEYRKDGTGRWNESPVPLVVGEAFSPPSRGPDRRVVYVDYSTVQGVLIELRESSGGWQEVHRYTPTDLNLTLGIFGNPSLTPDGLRLIFERQAASLNWPDTGDATFYTDRSSTSETFRAAEKLTTVPSGVVWPVLTEDCGRIYFSALNTVFYIKQ